MGSAAAFHAARAGLKVLGLEQYQVCNQFGSSHGHTRIFRVAHYGTDTLPRLAKRSGKLWEDLEEDSQKVPPFLTLESTLCRECCLDVEL